MNIDMEVHMTDTPTKAQIRAALGKYLRQTLEKHEDGRLDTVNIPNPQIASEKLEDIAQDIKAQLQGQPGPGQINVQHFTEQTGLAEIPQDNPLHKYTQRELLKLHASSLHLFSLGDFKALYLVNHAFKLWAFIKQGSIFFSKGFCFLFGLGCGKG